MLDPTTLRAWRDQRGLSRRAAADLLGLNERTLERLEYGRSGASPLWALLTRIVDLIEAAAGAQPTPVRPPDPRQPPAPDC